jgi:flagellar biosynthetic protein FliQ
MNYDAVSVELIRQTLLVALKIAAPILVAGVVFGLIISIAQSVTSIQDQTLSTVPKIVIMVAAAIVLLPWIIQRLMDFAAALFSFGLT